MDAPSNTQLLKIILVGDSQVGKTYIHYRFMKGRFPKISVPTIGVEFATKNITLQENQEVILQMWDTAGQEHYRPQTNQHFRKSQGAILVYDITKEKTFESLEQWLTNLKSQTDEDIVIMLIGNKKDIVDKNVDQRKVSLEQAQNFAQQNNLMFEEVSAESYENIENSINNLVSEIIKRKNQRKLDNKLEDQQQIQ